MAFLPAVAKCCFRTSSPASTRNASNDRKLPCAAITGLATQLVDAVVDAVEAVRH